MFPDIKHRPDDSIRCFMKETATGRETMQDILLLAVVTAATVYGWFLMKRLDQFLEVCRQARDLQDDLQSYYGNHKDDML